jgi:hypothetical protein
MPKLMAKMMPQMMAMTLTIVPSILETISGVTMVTAGIFTRPCYTTKFVK